MVSSVPQNKSQSLVVIPSTDVLIEDANTVISYELLRYRAISSRGKQLNPQEARVFQGFIKSLVELSKEEREREKLKDYSSMSDLELLSTVADNLSYDEFLEFVKIILKKKKEKKGNE